VGGLVPFFSNGCAAPPGLWGGVLPPEPDGTGWGCVAPPGLIEPQGEQCRMKHEEWETIGAHCRTAKRARTGKSIRPVIVSVVIAIEYEYRLTPEYEYEYELMTEQNLRKAKSGATPMFCQPGQSPTVNCYEKVHSAPFCVFSGKK